MSTETDNCIFRGVETNVTFKICISTRLFAIRGPSSRGSIVYILIRSRHLVFCCNVFTGLTLIRHGTLGNSAAGLFRGGILLGVDSMSTAIMVSRKKYFSSICSLNGKRFYSTRTIRSKITSYTSNDVDISYNVYDL